MSVEVGDTLIWQGRKCRVVGKDTSPKYNASRAPWFLQVVPVEGGEWISISLVEWKGQNKVLEQGNKLDIAC